MKICSGCGMDPCPEGPERWRKYRRLLKSYGFRVCKCGWLVKIKEN